jgi:short subunit dehydrogenase-like uncharacterized protein
MAGVHPGTEVRPAAVDSPGALDRAVDGAVAVINCAGPFARTSAGVIDAALRARIPYVDVAAEIEAVADTFAHYDARARAAGVVVLPAMAFYGGLGDLLATAAMGDWTSADEVCIAYALDSWRPTPGTRASGKVSRQRRQGRRVLYTNGRLAYRAGDARRVVDWTFPASVGEQAVVPEFTMADSVTIPRHIRTPEIRTYMTLAAVRDLQDPDSPPPVAADERGRSAQTFLVDVAVRSGGRQRRAVAAGRDIYAISAPLAVEATERVVGGLVDRTGALAPGEAFDAADLLRALPLERLTLDQPEPAPERG